MSRFEIFCHGCDTNTFGLKDSDGELECQACGGSFVEMRGQAGLSNFADTSGIPTGAELDADGDEIPGLTSLGDILSSSSGNDSSNGSGAQRNTGTSTSTNPANASDSAGTRTHASAGTSTQVPPQFRTMAQMMGLQGGQMGGGIMSMGAIGVSSTGQILHSGFPGQPQMSPFSGPGVGNPIEALLSQFVGGGGGMPFGMNPGAPGDAISDILHHILINESSHAGAPPASDAAIGALDLVEVTAENQEELGCCYITQDKFQIGDKALKLKCGHYFQQEGIKQWLKMHNTCPTCREPVNTATEVENAAAASASNTSALHRARADSLDSDSSMSLPDLTSLNGDDDDNSRNGTPTGLPDLVPLAGAAATATGTDGDSDEDDSDYEPEEEEEEEEETIYGYGDDDASIEY